MPQHVCSASQTDHAEQGDSSATGGCQGGLSVVRADCSQADEYHDAEEDLDDLSEDSGNEDARANDRLCAECDDGA